MILFFKVIKNLIGVAWLEVFLSYFSSFLYLFD